MSCFFPLLKKILQLAGCFFWLLLAVSITSLNTFFESTMVYKMYNNGEMELTYSSCDHGKIDTVCLKYQKLLNLIDRTTYGCIHKIQEYEKGSTEIQLTMVLLHLMRFIKTSDGVVRNMGHTFDRQISMENIFRCSRHAQFCTCITLVFDLI